MITIELIAHDTARHLGTPELSRSHSRKDPIGPLCRDLIKAGHDPETLVSVVRANESGDGYSPVFRPRRLGVWAAYDIRDRDGRGLVSEKFAPYAGPSAQE